MLEVKYGEMRSGDTCSNEVRGPFMVSLWKTTRKNWGEFSKHLTFKVGEGGNIQFWHNIWWDNLALKHLFSNLFGLLEIRGPLFQSRSLFRIEALIGMLLSKATFRIGKCNLLLISLAICTTLFSQMDK